MVILLSRCFVSKNPSLLKTAFSTYVRPILEYASPVWSPHLAKNITLLESVQRRFTKSIRNLRNIPYTSRLARLELTTLSLRRIHIDLCTCYRILHGLTVLNSSNFFTFRNSTNRGHPFSLIKPLVRLDSSKFSFHSRVIDTWNALPLAVVNAETIHSFKLKLKLITIHLE